MPVTFDHIETNEVTLSGTSVTATLSTTLGNINRAILLFEYIPSSTTVLDNPAGHQVQGVITNTTTLTFTRSGTVNNQLIRWKVIEFSAGVTVQRGATSLASTTQVDVLLTSVNLAKSFVILSGVVITGAAWGGDDFITGYLVDATHIRLQAAVASAGVVAWQVVTYDDCAVQRNVTTIATGGTSNTAAITAVDLTQTWLLTSARMGNGTAANQGQKMVRGTLVSNVLLQFNRDSTGIAADVRWELVEFTGTERVQYGSKTLSSSTLTDNVTLASAVNTSKAVATLSGLYNHSGSCSYSAADDIAPFTAHVELTSTTNVNLQRVVHQSLAATFDWFVIEWDPAAATQTMMAGAALVNATGVTPAVTASSSVPVAATAALVNAGAVTPVLAPLSVTTSASAALVQVAGVAATLSTPALLSASAASVNVTSMTAVLAPLSVSSVATPAAVTVVTVAPALVVAGSVALLAAPAAVSVMGVGAGLATPALLTAGVALVSVGSMTAALAPQSVSVAATPALVTGTAVTPGVSVGSVTLSASAALVTVVAGSPALLVAGAMAPAPALLSLKGVSPTLTVTGQATLSAAPALVQLAAGSPGLGTGTGLLTATAALVEFRAGTPLLACGAAALLATPAAVQLAGSVAALAVSGPAAVAAGAALVNVRAVTPMLVSADDLYTGGLIEGGSGVLVAPSGAVGLLVAVSSGSGSASQVQAHSRVTGHVEGRSGR